MHPMTGVAQARPEYASLGAPRYDLRNEIGRGRMGIVYRAHDVEAGIDVALKTISNLTPQLFLTLKAEFRALAGISHSNLVDFYELFVERERCFFTMELVDGVSFLDYVRPTGHLDVSRLIVATRQLVACLQTLHSHGKLHRDLKPSNVLVADTGRVVLLDFGLASVLGATMSDGSLGTPLYAAPEQILGHSPQPDADWYSVGVMLYEALCGDTPFAATPAPRLLQAKLGYAPPLACDPSTFPSSTGELIRQLLSAAPQRRPRGDDILAELEGLLTSPGLGNVALSVGPRLHVGSHGAAKHTVPHFVGRDAELAQLHTQFERTLSGNTAIVHIVGPSGIGKSSLVRHFIDNATSEVAPLVLGGRCHPQELVPFKAFDGVVDALSGHLATLPHRMRPALADAEWSALLRLFPVLGQATGLQPLSHSAAQPAQSETRRKAFRALRSLLSQLAQQRPLILWIDDFQWTDADSNELLRGLFGSPSSPAVCLLLSYRNEDLELPLVVQDSAHEITSWWQEHTCEVRLAGLDATAALTLAHNECPSVPAADPRLAHLIEHCGGSPFFIAELARQLVHTQVLADLQLKDLVAERLRHLPTPARHILEIIAVAGTEVTRSFALTAAALGERGRPLVTALERHALVRTTSAGEVHRVEVYHDRFREALLAQLDATELQARHAAIADTLEGRADANPEMLYRHSLAAGRQERAGHWAAQAADRAAASLAFVRAAELYAQALRLKPWEKARTLQLEMAQGDALINAGHAAEGARILNTASIGCAGDTSLQLRCRATENLLVSGHTEEGIACVQALMKDVGLDYPRSRAIALLRALFGGIELFRRRHRPSSVRRPGRDHRVATEVLADIAYAVGRGLIVIDSPRGLHLTLEALLHAQETNDPERIAKAMLGLGAALVASGGLLARAGSRLLAEAGEIALETAPPHLEGLWSISQAQDSLAHARWAEMLERTDTGTTILRDQCRGAIW